MSPLTVLAVVSAIVVVANGAMVPVGSLQISDGTTAKAGQFPEMASVQVNRYGATGGWHHCGGALIAPNWVLTSAYCILSVPWDDDVEAVSVLLGSINCTVWSQPPPVGQRIKVKQSFAHPSYDINKGAGPNDIGLLLLEEDAKLNSDVKVASLPKSGAIPSGKATLLGWGNISKKDQPEYPALLQYAENIPLVDFKTCKKFIDKALPNAKDPLEETNVCAGDLKKAGVMACGGDKGGPLLQRSGWFFKKTTVIGVSSWGLAFDCGNEPSPNVYARVSAYTDWIADVMSKNR